MLSTSGSTNSICEFLLVCTPLAALRVALQAAARLLQKTHPLEQQRVMDPQPQKVLRPLSLLQAFRLLLLQILFLLQPLLLLLLLQPHPAQPPTLKQILDLDLQNRSRNRPPQRVQADFSISFLHLTFHLSLQRL